MRARQPMKVEAAQRMSEVTARPDRIGPIVRKALGTGCNLHRSPDGGSRKVRLFGTMRRPLESSGPDSLTGVCSAVFFGG